MSQQRRVVITGMGVVSPVGNDLRTFWSNLTNGVIGIDRITQFDVTEYDCRIAGEVKNFEPAEWFKDAKAVRLTDRYSQLPIAAARMAIAESGLHGVRHAQSERCGWMMGSGVV